MKSLWISTAMLAFSCAAVADSSFTGTWKLNRAKQKFSERTILKIEAEGGGIR